MEKLKFKSYEKIKQINSEKFQVTEKIHGANYSFLSNGGDVIACRRNGIIADDEKFFGHSIVYNRYRDSILDLIKAIDHEDVQIYGEIAGSGVLSSIDYGEKDFYVFNVRIGTAYIGIKKTLKLCHEHGLKTVPYIGEMVMEETLDLPLNVKSRVCDSAFIEGYVISNGDITLKRISPRFAEIKEPKKTIIEVNKERSDLALNQCTLIRAEKVYSKIGGKNIGEILSALRVDIEADIGKINKNDFKAANVELVKIVKRMINEG